MGAEQPTNYQHGTHSQQDLKIVPASLIQKQQKTSFDLFMETCVLKQNSLQQSKESQPENSCRKQDKLKLIKITKATSNSEKSQDSAQDSLLKKAKNLQSNRQLGDMASNFKTESTKITITSLMKQLGNKPKQSAAIGDSFEHQQMRNLFNNFNRKQEGIRKIQQIGSLKESARRQSRINRGNSMTSQINSSIDLEPTCSILACYHYLKTAYQKYLSENSNILIQQRQNASRK